MTQQRIKGESAKAHAAYLDYRDMGITRSLRKLQQAYTAPDAPPDRPTRNLTTLETWSSRFGWQSRVKEYDAQIQSERDAMAAQRRLEERENRSLLLERFRYQIDDQLKHVNLMTEDGIKAFTAATRAFKAYMEISMKQYNDMPTTHADITSGGNPVQVTFNTEPISADIIHQRLEALGLADIVRDHES